MTIIDGLNGAVLTIVTLEKTFFFKIEVNGSVYCLLVIAQRFIKSSDFAHPLIESTNFK